MTVPVTSAKRHMRNIADVHSMTLETWIILQCKLSLNIKAQIYYEETQFMKVWWSIAANLISPYLYLGPSLHSASNTLVLHVRQPCQTFLEEPIVREKVFVNKMVDVFTALFVSENLL